MKEMKQHSIKYNFLMNFVLSASQFIFPLITFPYVSRVLLAEGSGKVTFVASVANYFSMVASLGIPTYGIRACAQVRDDRDKLSKTAHELLIINSITTLLVVVTYIACVLLVPRFRTERTLFLINGINILLNMFGMNWLFQALEQYDYITFRSILFKIVSVFLMLALVHEKTDYVIYGGIAVFAAVGSNLLNLLRARKYIDFKWIGNYNLRRHIKPIVVLFAQSLAVSIYTNMDTVMLGFMKEDVDVGYYNAAVKVKTILLSLVSSLGSVLLPRMSYYAKEHMKMKFMETTSMALNFTMLISFPLALYFSMFSAECIRFLAGNGYAGAVAAMQIITIAIIPIGLTGILGVQVLTAIEKEKYVLYSVIVGATLDFILNLLLIPSLGATGAAFATMLAEFAVLAVQIIYTRDIICQIRSKLRWERYIGLSILTAIIGVLTRTLPIKSTFLELVVSAIAFFSVYGMGLLVLHDEFALKAMNLMKIKLKRSKE